MKAEGGILHFLKNALWICPLYFTEGLPNVIVVIISAVMYKRLGLDNESVTLYTSWLYLPWVIKPFWSPIVDTVCTKRWWIHIMQLFLGASMAGVAFTLNIPNYIQWTLAFFWLLAFSSATHDIAADGFYMLKLSSHEQALFSGIRSTFYRIATISGQGLLIMLAGTLEAYTKNPVKAWSYTFWFTAILFMCMFLYNYVSIHYLTRAGNDIPMKNNGFEQIKQMGETFFTFFTKPYIITAIAFMLLYRFPEALLVKIVPLFLIEKYSAGGLGLTTAQLGFVHGTVGVLGLILGGILGGIVVAFSGFKKSLLPMVLSISLPNVVYILLAYYQPQSIHLISISIFIEQFGYGFGFTAYMLFLIYFSQGPSKTAHYAFCTGFMALGMMLPGMAAGWLQERLGYLNFFIFVMLLVPLTFIVSALVKVDDEFGKKEKVEDAPNPRD